MRRRRPTRASASTTITNGRSAGAWCRPAPPTRTRSTTAPGSRRTTLAFERRRPRSAPLSYREGLHLPGTKLEDLYRRPGFMIRRAHQISVSLFLAETGALGITNRQYGILFALRHRPGIDQISVARLLGLDRSTTGMVIKKLQAAGLIGRAVG